jgi:hypothetical protein
MKLCKVRLKPAARSRYNNAADIIGNISRWDIPNERLFVLGRKQSGALGRDGTEIKFEDCVGVYLENAERPGTFDDSNQIPLAKQHYTKYGAQYPK